MMVDDSNVRPDAAGRDHSWAYGDIVYRPASRTIEREHGGLALFVQVRPAAGVVFRALMQSDGEWMSCEDIQRVLGSAGYKQDPVTVRQDIIILRRTLAEIQSALSIQSIRNTGYRLVGGNSAVISLLLSQSEVDALSRIVAATSLSHPRDSQLIHDILTRRI